MNPIFQICQNDGCSITITGLSYEHGQYVDEDSSVQPYNKFKYKDTATINIVESTSVEETKLLKGEIIDHCSYLDEWEYKLNGDGFYTISHIILPTVKCIERVKLEEPDIINQYSIIYAVHRDKIYKLIDSNWKEVTFKELVNINPCNTTIFKSVKDFFSICFLWKCYVDICKNLLKGDLIKCKQTEDLEQLAFNRDVVWMTINVIKYYIKKDQLYEAQRILEEINGCNGFCNEAKRIIKKGGCGCGK